MLMDTAPQSNLNERKMTGKEAGAYNLYLDYLAKNNFIKNICNIL